MSIRLMSQAWELNLPQTEKMVLLCLCDHANDNGECWPSIDTLARKCSVSDRTIQRTIRKLVSDGVLTAEMSNGRKANSYRIDLSQPRHSVTPTECHPDTVSPLTPTMTTSNPDTVSPEPLRTTIKPSDDCASGDASDFSADDFLESWNAAADRCGLPKMRMLTKARKTAFRVRKREYPDIADWQAAFRCLQNTKWLHGDNQRGWRADPDFFLQAKSFTKLVEGSYAEAENRNGNSVGFADRRDGAAKALDRRLGLDCDAGAFGRRDAGGGGGSGELAIARSAQLR